MLLTMTSSRCFFLQYGEAAHAHVFWLEQALIKVLLL